MLKMCRRVFDVLFFGGSNLSLLRLFVRRRRKESIFDIFDIFVVCVLFLSFITHKQRSLKDDDVFVFFSRDGQTNNCCDDDYCD
jgi:hypothetical protein